MKRTVTFVLALLSISTALIQAQVKRTSIPVGDALAKTTANSSLTVEGAQAFHIRITISEPENPQSPYQGSIEQWWSSPRQWRREVTSHDGLKQIIVYRDGVKTEQDTGDYFPLWLRNFVTAAFDPVPDAAAWTAAGTTIDQITMPNSAKSDACAKAKSTIGSGDHAADAFLSFCFDAQGRLSFYGSPRYGMEFHDYRSFGKKQFPRQFKSDPEPGTTLIGAVSVLEPLSPISNAEPLFAALDRNEDRFKIRRR